MTGKETEQELNTGIQELGGRRSVKYSKYYLKNKFSILKILVFLTPAHSMKRANCEVHCMLA